MVSEARKSRQVALFVKLHRFQIKDSNLQFNETKVLVAEDGKRAKRWCLLNDGTISSILAGLTRLSRNKPTTFFPSGELKNHIINGGIDISIAQFSEANPLSKTTGVASFINGSSDEGGALSAFGVEYGHDGKPMNSDINYSVLGFSLDDLFEKSVLTEIPSLIKIDVDGIEHLILKGASKTLKSEKLKSLFIEVNDDFEEQAHQVKTILESAGFTLKEKRQSEMLDGCTKFGGTYNQIWIKN